MAARIASAALALLATTTRAQYSGWMEDQANATMCTWKLPRGERPARQSQFGP